MESIITIYPDDRQFPSKGFRGRVHPLRDQGRDVIYEIGSPRSLASWRGFPQNQPMGSIKSNHHLPRIRANDSRAKNYWNSPSNLWLGAIRDGLDQNAVLHLKYSR